MAKREPLLIAAIVLALLAGGASAQTGGRGPLEQPVDPPVPIGCLLSPSCGPNLFVGPDGLRVLPHAPVDPGRGLPCLLRDDCSQQLGAYRRAVTVDSVVQNGASVGDYLTLDQLRSLRLAPTPRRAAPGAAPHAECAASLIGADEVAKRAATSAPASSSEKQHGIAVVAQAYTSAMAACSDLRQ